MSKTLYLIDSINNKQINASCHLTSLLPHIEALSNITTKRCSLQTTDMMAGIKDINANADIVFLVHDFTFWNDGLLHQDNGRFSHFIRSLWNNKNIFVFPTEMAPAALIKSQFKENAMLMNKIVVGSESFRKLFIKVDQGLAVPANKIKFINIPTHEFQYRDSATVKTRNKVNTKILFTPGLLHPAKDYIALLRGFMMLRKKYKNMVYVMALKSHSTVSPQQTDEMKTAIYDFIHANNLVEHVRLYFDTLGEEKYHSFMRIADLVVFPQDNSLDMYNGCMVDALAMGKAIVSPSAVFADDLVKKTSVLLYQYESDISFYDACSVVLENLDFRNIVEQHNYEYGQTLAYPKIAQQYVNQIKRFKFN